MKCSWLLSQRLVTPVRSNRILFDKPVMLMAGHWYVAYASVSSPSDSSSDAGSSGQNEIQGQDK